MEIRSVLAASVLLFSTGNLRADSIDNAYRSMMGTMLYTLNNYTLHSGTYHIDGKGNSGDVDLKNITIPGTYFFGDLFEDFRPYVQGAVGYSHYEQDHADFGTTSGDIDTKGLYIKAGGGVSYTFQETFTLMGGASALYLGSDGDYGRIGAFHPKADAYFNTHHDDWLYDLYASAGWHPKFQGYKPYLILTAHYLTLDYDPSELSDDHGWSGDLRLGFFTHELARWWDMPVKAEVFVNTNALDHDLGELTGFDTALSGGTTFYWKVGSKLPWYWLKELDLTFTLKGTVSNTDMSGYNIGFGMSLVKF